MVQKAKEEFEASAKRLGFNKVSEAKRAVVLKIRDFTAGGGFLFAMCSATDSYDIALAAKDIDICESMFDGDGADPQAQEKLNFDNTFAFKDFSLEKNPNQYEYSSIDATRTRKLKKNLDFSLCLNFLLSGTPYLVCCVKTTNKSLKGLWVKLLHSKKNT